MSHRLPADVWNCIFFFLNQPQINNLAATGDKWLFQFISRRKVVVYRFVAGKPILWPSNIHSNSSITELELSAFTYTGAPAQCISTDFGTNSLPRTLTSLTLQFSFQNCRSWPFCAPIQEATDQIKLLSSHFPSLHTLKTRISVDEGWLFSWTLPQSLTYFSSLESSNLLLHHEVPLPPKLRFCRGCFGPRNAKIKFPSTLETLICNLPADCIVGELPHLHTLSVLRASVRLNDFPALTALGSTELIQDSLWMAIKLPHLHYYNYTTRHINLTHLPQTITQMNRHSFPSQYFFQSDVLSALKELQLSDWMQTRIPHRFFANLPRSLTKLDMSNIVIPKIIDGLKQLPPTLTSLASRSINLKTVGSLALLPNLVELKMIEGVLTAKIVLLLPRQLTSLSLSNIRLFTKGRFVLPGSTTPVMLSKSQPDISPLRGTLPPQLKALDIFARGRHSFWWTHAYDILIDIPISLQVLRLNFGKQVMNIHPRSNSTIPSNLTPQDRSTDLFERLVNLRHLYLVCRASDEDQGWFARRLPPNLYAYRGPLLTETEIQLLPKSIHLLNSRTCPPFRFPMLHARLGHYIQHYWLLDLPDSTFNPMADPLTRQYNELANL